MEWTDIRLTVAKSDANNAEAVATMIAEGGICLLYTSPSPRDYAASRMPSSA